jgi:hypothetical protein
MMADPTIHPTEKFILLALCAIVQCLNYDHKEQYPPTHHHLSGCGNFRFDKWFARRMGSKTEGKSAIYLLAPRLTLPQ